MDKLQQNLEDLNKNIQTLNLLITKLTQQGIGVSNSNNGVMTKEMFKAFLLEEDIQVLVTKIVQYNNLFQKPMPSEEVLPPVIEPTKPTVVAKVVPGNVIISPPVVRPEPIIEEAIVGIIYTVRSPKNGYFTETEEFLDLQRAQYCIELHDVNKGSFSIAKVDLTRFIFKREKFLLEACAIEEDEGVTDVSEAIIETMTKGAVEKDNTGWRIIKKAVIKIKKGN
jgi:hypothetical protein